MRTVIPIIADSVPVDGLKGSRGGVGVKSGVAVGLLRWLAQGFAIEGEAVRGVDEAIKDGWIVVSMKNDWKRIFTFE